MFYDIIILNHWNVQTNKISILLWLLTTNTHIYKQSGDAFDKSMKSIYLMSITKIFKELSWGKADVSCSGVITQHVFHLLADILNYYC